ncbi:Erp family outer-surface lipoprotein [Borreliella burgdorferi]|uniref:Erp family outer-surface lipoprotein n=1 Tax=Borreliella burgdorferi TaxID=139 RepID=UPI00016C3F00|nr:Erp family outer-surface lipoprotein [Borreliella burgdorferi]ACN92383.1 lipoprotein OspE variant [Borreliella burgdorferi 94a]
MNKIMKNLIICAVFAMISSCKNYANDKDEKSLEQNLKGKAKGFLDTKKEELVGGFGKLGAEIQLKDEELMQADGQSNGKIKFSKFTVKIKNKDSSNNWADLGTLVVEREEDGIATGLNNDAHGGGHTATFFSLEEEEVNNFVKAMIEGGSFKTDEYYGYRKEQSNLDNGTSNKEIITKIEKIDGTEYITFLGDKIKNSGDKVAEYAISLEELKKNLK